MRCDCRFAAVVAMFACVPAPAITPPAPCGEMLTRMFPAQGPRTIPDPGSTSVPILVSDMGAYVWDVDLTTIIFHNFVSDLTVTLTAPNGTAVTLTSRNGSGSDNVFAGTTWDDQAMQSPTPGERSVLRLGFPPNNVTQSPLLPEEPLSAFDGINPNGTWTLTVQDSEPFEQGFLDGAVLALTTLPGPPAGETTYVSTITPNAPIAPGANVSRTIEVGHQLGSVTRVTCRTNIVHPRGGDLTIWLTSPSGTKVVLTERRGGLNANVFNGTVWRDDAGLTNPPGPVSDTVFANNVVETPLAPEEPLGAFKGEPGGGPWTLTVQSFSAPGINGVLSAVELSVTVCGDGPCPADITGDGLVNASDLAILLAQWGMCP